MGLKARTGAPVARGRIFFPGNPWPEGHALDELRWWAHIVPDRGLAFVLQLRSAHYDAERAGDDELDSGGSWTSPGVWCNYNRCRVSASFWPGGGWIVGTDDDPLVFADLGEREHVVDDPTAADFDAADLDARAFDIYLLGHDDVADHRIRLLPEAGGATWSLQWRGRIALAYAGDYEFRHDFRAEASGLEFTGFELADGMSPVEGVALVERWCADPGPLQARTVENRRMLVPA